MTGHPARVAAALVFVASALPGRVARGQDAAATAETLFEDGRRLLAEGHYTEACPKLAESERLDPAVGTLLNLGDCYEKMGKLASAWATFKEAAALAERAKQATREKIAMTRAAALEPRVPRLAIRIPHAESGLEVRRDGILLGASEWAADSPSPVPTDPGDHDLVVSAPGKKPWTKKVTVAGDGQTVTVDVPSLEIDELADRAPLQPPTAGGMSIEAVTAHDQNVQRTLGIIIGAAGIVSMVVAIPFGARAISYNNSAKAECPTNDTCQGNGQSDADTAVFSGTLSTVLLMAGAAVAVTGVVVYLTAPTAKKEKRAVRFLPMVGPGAAGVVGTF